MMKRVDYGGAILCIVGVTLFLLGLTWAITSGWGSAQCLAPLLIGLAIMVGFVFYEWKIPREPNVPLRLFKNINFSLCCFVMFIMGWSMNGGSFYMPQFFQNVNGWSATQAGIRTIPWIGPFIPVSMAGGIISSKKGWYLPFPKVGLALAAVGLGLVSIWTTSTPYGTQAGIMVMLGIGFGASLSMIMLAVQANCELKDIGPGTTVGTFLRTIGGTIGIGLGGTILQSTTQSILTPDYVISLAQQYGCSPLEFGSVIQAAAQGRPMPSGVPEACVQGGILAMQNAYAAGYSKVFLSYAPICAAGWLAALFLKHVPLRGKGPAAKKPEEVKGAGDLEKVAAGEMPVEEKKALPAAENV